MSESLVSIVVPTFNRAHCLARALDSALNQTHRNVEVIVIDDGSTDSTESLIKTRYAADPRVRYFKQANAGVTAARNAGLSRVRGDFVALLDSDDLWMPWKLSLQIACMEKCPEIGMVWTDMDAIDPHGKIVHPAYLKQMYSCWRRFSTRQLFLNSYTLAEIAPELLGEFPSAVLHTGDVYSKMFMGSLVHTSTVLLRRDRFDKVKGFNEQLKVSGEDYDFHWRTCREGPVGFVDVPSIHYQTGMADCLTQNKYEVQIAANTLTTITMAHQQDPSRIQISPAMIKERFAEVHAWCGEALLDTGERAGARRHLAKSLMHRPCQARTARLLALACVPPGIGKKVRSIYRRSKKVSSVPAGAPQQTAT